MYFWKYRLKKIWLDKCLKRRVSEDPWTDNTANGSTHCCNLNGSTSTLFINHCEGSCTHLVIHIMLRLFVNTLTVNDKHYLLNWDNLVQPIQMQLSQKQKTFSQFFFCIFKIFIKFQTFSEKR